MDQVVFSVKMTLYIAKVYLQNKVEKPYDHLNRCVKSDLTKFKSIRYKTQQTSNRGTFPHAANGHL